ncbi:tetratricopeptide repeat protein [Streptomyces sp. NPDC001815]|uniref:tetratricopeptide repeat protein n=1 Tax=Streptomyces sp. NPDC001815 TaxID=3154526 RepID=UPI0033304B04
METTARSFTGRRSELAAARPLLRGDGPTRLLVFTGVSGMGKSTLLARLADESPLPTTHLLDAASFQAGMAVPREGGEQAALELIRVVAAALASAAPWWRRRWVRQQAEAIGVPRPWGVRVLQWASRGGVIANSPVRVTVPGLTQAERRVGWVQGLLVVARAVRRRRITLLMDTCEWLMFFDDVRAEQPRSGEPLGVGAWFADVLEQLFHQIPELRAIAAGTAVPDTWRRGDAEGNRYEVHQLTAWKAADTNTYLLRRGLSMPDGLVDEITERSQGLPAEVAWIADALTGVLSNGRSNENTAETWASFKEMQEQSTDGHRRLRTHVLARISDRNRRLLNAAAVLGTFTPQALHAVAFHSTVPSVSPLQDSEWFGPLSRMSCLRELPASRGHWQLHRTTRTWLLAVMAEDDAHHTPDKRLLPPLHQAAAAYYEALNDGAFNAQSAHHHFAVGDDRYASAWTGRIVDALHADPADNLSLQILTDAVLCAPGLRKTLPRLFADAHLIRAYLTSTRANHAAAQEHAQQALAAYQEQGHAGACKAAVLAGQIAWNRSSYNEAAAHWTTALHTGETVLPDLPAALAEAVCRTGDLHHADELLAQALHHAQAAEAQPRESARPPKRAQPATVSESVPVPSLADAVPTRLRPAHLHLLVSDTAARLCNWTRSAEHADLALEHADGEPHVSALAHRNYARLATHTWDLRSADGHTKAGFAAARSCPDRRCIALLQLAQADLAERKARWAQPRPAAPAMGASLTPTTAPAISSSAASRLSLTERAEAAHQMELAANARATAAELATELGDIRTLAQSLIEDDPAHALSLFRSMGDQLGEAHVLGIQTDTLRRRGDMESATKQYLRALRLLRTLGDRLGQAQTLGDLAQASIRLGDLKAAERWASQSLAIFRAIDDRFGEGSVLLTLGEMARVKGDVELAERRGLEALAIFQDVGDRLGQGHALGDLAETAMRIGDVPSAERRAREALALSRITGDVPSQVEALMPLAVIARRRGEAGLAEELGLEAVALSRGIEDLQRQAHALFMLSDTARVRGDVELAEERGQESLALYRSAGDLSGQANALFHLADTARVRGDLKSAEERGTEGLTLARLADDLLCQANGLASLAETARAQNDLELAEQRGSESLTLACDSNDLLGQANALDALAETAHARGDTATAHRLFGKAAALYDDTGVPSAAELCRQRQQAV